MPEKRACKYRTGATLLLLALGFPVCLEAQDAEGRLAATIAYLQGLGTRFAWTTRSDAAALYLKARIEAMGIPAVLDTFSFRGPVRDVAGNVLASLGPRGEGRIVLGAHYDSISLYSYSDSLAAAPGADDNGSGCAVLLELMDRLRNQPLGIQVDFAFFAGEETGRLGSEAYSSRLERGGGRILGMISVDAVGYQPDTTWSLRLYFDENSRPFAERCVQAFKSAAPEIGVDTILAPNWQSSDNYSFWRHGFAAVHLYEGFDNPHLHTEADTLGNVNLTFLARITEAFSTLVLDIAGAPLAPSNVATSPAFPNPSRGPFTVPFLVRSQVDLTVQVIDPLGRRVALLFQGRKRPGPYTITWSPPPSMPPGLYVIAFSSLGETSARKVILLK